MGDPALSGVLWCPCSDLKRTGEVVRLNHQTVECTDREGESENLMEGVDPLLISLGLVHGRCEESLAVLRGKRERMGVPVPSLSSTVKEGLLHEQAVRIGQWPIHIEGLTREIEGALRMSAHILSRSGTLQLALLHSSVYPSAWKGVCDIGGWTWGAVLSTRLRRKLATAYGASGWFHRRGPGAMGVVVQPSARETFTPRELVAAFKEFTERGPQYLEAETGIRASAYRFGEHVLLVYEEAETGVVVLMHPSA